MSVSALQDNSDSPLVSLIVPSFNEREDIAATLDSVLAVQYEKKEIIAVDDSTDETALIVQSYEKHGIRVLRQAHPNGLNGAYNLGITAAKGEIVVLLTADNRPGPTFLDRLVKHYQNGADY